MSLWKGHRRYAADCIWNIVSWNTVVAAMLGQAESRGLIDWGVSVDSAINRADQHCTTSRAAQGSVSMDKNMPGEPPGRAIGTSRSGLGIKIH
ncbi:hypothetical protein [Paeniglutamicibacter psychrophenolicus]|uniref:hypothetical protein n=1 Tax=Paeniglutamicibacter psychrophenolicus TaxID=257454 RepID=UPI002784430B|nr:hypothetical protein [Paeniglutamicibacter psychrophenolicus]MDQ0096164.1 hypothetical protein [Paeniglutamicibacter psychrophenolicus]